MIKDAEKFKADDEKIVRKVEARGEPDHYVYSRRNTIKNHRHVLLIPESKRRKVEDAIDEVINRLDDYQLPTVQDSKAKLRKLKEICEPVLIVMKKRKSQKDLFNVKVKVEQDWTFFALCSLLFAQGLIWQEYNNFFSKKRNIIIKQCFHHQRCWWDFDFGFACMFFGKNM